MPRKNYRISARRRMTFDQCFSKSHIEELYEERIAAKKSAGIDGIGLDSFEESLSEHLDVINRKARRGSYSFTPYAEIQVSKGRGKAPRILGLPTLRDQLTMSALKDYLHHRFPDSVNRRLPNSFVFELQKKILEILDDVGTYGFIRADIASFYDCIDREKMMNFVRRKVSKKEALKLIYNAVTNPVVPRTSPRHQRFKYFQGRGVPQGLAISNILANIYLQEFDKRLRGKAVLYQRYVDDILLICPLGQQYQVLDQIRFESARLGLELNDEKTEIGVVGDDTFDFLGYRLIGNGRVSVRHSSIQRMIESLAAKITAADRRRDQFREEHPKLTDDIYEKVLIQDLNERITGAISSHKQYGWLFYFSQIDDLALLHRLDRIMHRLCNRCKTLGGRLPTELKSFPVAYREIHRLRRGATTSYIPKYDEYEVDEKEEFLLDRGLLTGGKRHPKEEIRDKFARLIARRMKRLEMDLKRLS